MRNGRSLPSMPPPASASGTRRTTVTRRLVRADGLTADYGSAAVSGTGGWPRSCLSSQPAPRAESRSCSASAPTTASMVDRAPRQRRCHSAQRVWLTDRSPCGLGRRTADGADIRAQDLLKISSRGLWHCFNAQAPPGSVHQGAKDHLAQIWNAEDKPHALKAVKAPESIFGLVSQGYSPIRLFGQARHQQNLITLWPWSRYTRPNSASVNPRRRAVINDCHVMAF